MQIIKRVYNKAKHFSLLNVFFILWLSYFFYLKGNKHQKSCKNGKQDKKSKYQKREKKDLMNENFKIVLQNILQGQKKHKDI